MEQQITSTITETVETVVTTKTETKVIRTNEVLVLESKENKAKKGLWKMLKESVDAFIKIISLIKLFSSEH